MTYQVGLYRTRITGQKFGKYTVERDDIFETKRWKSVCKCDCGNYQIVTNSELMSGRATQCKECHDHDRIKDYAGQRFNNWLIIKFIEMRNRKAIFEVMCKCGYTAQKDIRAIISGRTKNCMFCAIKHRRVSWKRF